jgi:cell division septation protein DedD
MLDETAQRGAPEIRVGEVFAGHAIEAELGRGGMGVVYRATDMRLNRATALKVIAPALSADGDFRRRFQRESQLAASVRHPHVVPIFQAGESDGLLFVTMELIEGFDLRSLIGTRGRLDAITACEVVAQVAGALDAAHSSGLVHRDVKPANVLIRNEGALHAYLTDFGLTKRTSSQSGITKSGLFVGTVDYAAPEQIKGSPVDARADVYALGCVLFEMLAGTPPFRRENEYATIYAHTSSPPPDLDDFAPGIQPALKTVVMRALAKDPDDRFPSAGDLGRAASAAAVGRMASQPERTVAVGRAAPSDDAPPAPPPPPSPVAAPVASPPPERVTSVLAQSRHGAWLPALFALVAVLLVGGGAVAAVVLTRGDSAKPSQEAQVTTRTVAGPTRVITTPAPKPAVQTPAPAARDRGYVAQLGYFTKLSGARTRKDEAESRGVRATLVDSDDYTGIPAGGWAVYEGYFNSYAAASAAAARYGNGAFPKYIARKANR